MLKSNPVPVAVVKFRRVRGCAKATRKLAKTDALDAQVLAHIAAVIQPEAWESADEESLRSLESVAR